MDLLGRLEITLNRILTANFFSIPSQQVDPKPQSPSIHRNPVSHSMFHWFFHHSSRTTSYSNWGLPTPDVKYGPQYLSSLLRENFELGGWAGTIGMNSIDSYQQHSLNPTPATLNLSFVASISSPPPGNQQARNVRASTATFSSAGAGVRRAFSVLGVSGGGG